MILSASTLGAPQASLGNVIDSLASAGISGIELRVAPGAIVQPGMDPEALRRIRGAIEAAGIQLTGLASYVKIAQPGPDKPVVAELASALEMAHILGAPAVRVFPGAEAQPAGPMARPRLIEAQDEVDERAARRLSQAAAAADRYTVLPVIETHDSHPSGRDIARLAAKVKTPVGVVWDLMHPWRVGESLAETWEALRPWLTAGLGSVQVKDARLPQDSTPSLIGEGSLPCEEFGNLLVSQGYSGVVTLELEAVWYPAAPPFAIALTSARRWSARHWKQEAA